MYTCIYFYIYYIYTYNIRIYIYIYIYIHVHYVYIYMCIVISHLVIHSTVAFWGADKQRKDQPWSSEWFVKGILSIWPHSSTCQVSEIEGLTETYLHIYIYIYGIHICMYICRWYVYIVVAAKSYGPHADHLLAGTMENDFGIG